ncbi:hypothetical protein HGRIS_004572 [Hohenbuehelia grisea]|uniref:Uncharacterized protein n=1 Tax=Hohenbuehelia grisea TaxID=104357 RepID=A0ABR3JCX6_9AGAR
MQPLDVAQPMVLDSPAARPPRRARPAYIQEKRNGFLEHSEATTDVQRLAQYILAKKARPIPSLQEMKDALAHNDSTRVKKRIADLQDQYHKDLLALHEFHAQEYDEEHFDRFVARDLSQTPHPDENRPMSLATYKALDDLYDRLRQDRLLPLKFQDDLSHMRHAYLQQLLPLRTELAQLIDQEKHAQRIRDSQFPQTVDDYYAIHDKDIQLRIANFLVSPKEKQERIMTQFGWAHLQVKELRLAYNENVTRDVDLSHLLGLTDGFLCHQIIFQTQIKKKTAELTEVRDPRKNRPA